MKDGVRVFGASIQVFHGFFRWQDNQFDFAPPGLTPNLIHHLQSSGARADYQMTAFPRYLLLQRKRRMTESVPKFLGWFLLALANLSSVDHDIVAVLNAIDPNFPE